MASVQEPEVQFAQKLASNEKPTRTKAIKKLRKYISVRSQRVAGRTACVCVCVPPSSAPLAALTQRAHTPH